MCSIIFFSLFIRENLVHLRIFLCCRKLKYDYEKRYKHVAFINFSINGYSTHNSKTGDS